MKYQVKFWCNCCLCFLFPLLSAHNVLVVVVVFLHTLIAGGKTGFFRLKLSHFLLQVFLGNSTSMQWNF